MSGIASTAATGLALSTIETWVSGGAASVLQQTAGVLTQTTAPRLESPWFSAAYWKVAGLAAVLTLPFLFAASVQAMLRSDLTLLLRAVFGYLPLAMLAVAIAAPLTMLLLAASDQLAAAVSSASGHQSVSFLEQVLAPLGTVAALSGSPFVVFLLGLFTVAGALMLWIELLMREAAVYVIVLMLPLAFAALVWPARRIWAIRSVELLAALILSKFAIVAVLSLGGAALSHGVHSNLAGVLAGVVLLILAAFTPWALLRLLPLAEVASGAAAALRGQSSAPLRVLQHADAWASEAQRWTTTMAKMRSAATQAKASPPVTGPPARASSSGAAESAPGGAQEASSAHEAGRPTRDAVPERHVAGEPVPERDAASERGAVPEPGVPGREPVPERGPSPERGPVPEPEPGVPGPEPVPERDPLPDLANETAPPPAWKFPQRLTFGPLPKDPEEESGE